MVFSPAKVRTEWGFCASDLVSTSASRFRCGHKVCGVFDRDHVFSLDLCYGRVWTWIGSSTVVKLILFIQGLGSSFESGCFIYRTQWVTKYGSINLFWIKGLPLARSDWMASCVSDRESSLVKSDTSSRCVVQFCWCWTTCCVCVFNFVRIDVSGRRIICPLRWGVCCRSWSQSYINSCGRWCDHRFCGMPVLQRDLCLRRILAVSATWLLSTENLHWGFGLVSYWFYRLCNQIQGRTPVWFSSVCGYATVLLWFCLVWGRVCGTSIHHGLWLFLDDLWICQMFYVWGRSFMSSSEPSLVDQFSTWGRLWSMNSWVMASMMNYLTKNISELFIVLYNHIAIFSKSARPTFSKADTETVL